MEDSYRGFLSMGDSCGGFLWGNSRLWGIPVEDSYGGIPVYIPVEGSYGGIPVYGGFLWRIPMGEFPSMGDSCGGFL